jgi:hypothetical protein
MVTRSSVDSHFQRELMCGEAFDPPSVFKASVRFPHALPLV